MSLLDHGFTKNKVDNSQSAQNKRKEISSPSKYPQKSLQSDLKKSCLSIKGSSKSPSKSPDKSKPSLKLKSAAINVNQVAKSPSKTNISSKQKTPIKLVKNPNSKKMKDSPSKDETKSPKMKTPLSTPDKISKLAQPIQKNSPQKESPSKSNIPSNSNAKKKISIPTTPKENPDLSLTSCLSPGETLLPAQRVKLIMRSCPDVEAVPQEALFLVMKSTELFIDLLVNESYGPGLNSVDYESLSRVVHSRSWLSFLKETIPRKITWAEAQRRIASRKKDSIDDYL